MLWILRTRYGVLLWCSVGMAILDLDLDLDLYCNFYLGLGPGLGLGTWDLGTWYPWVSQVVIGRN